MAGLSTAHVAMLGVGGILVYSAIRNVNPLDTIKATLTGENPAELSKWEILDAAPTGRVGLVSPPPTMGDTSTNFNSPKGYLRARVLERARKEIGDPYEWAAEGPFSWDCSGLTQRVYKQAANIQLPRTSILQSMKGKAVSMKDAQPADLIFFGNPVHHVAIYVGDGKILHAPRTGTKVRIDPIWYNEKVFARDVIGR